MENIKIQRVSFSPSSIKVKKPGERQQNQKDRRFDQHLLKEEKDERNKRRKKPIEHQGVKDHKQMKNKNGIVFNLNPDGKNEKIRQVDIMA